MKFVISLLASWMLLSLVSCDYINLKRNDSTSDLLPVEKPIARVNENYLFPKDIAFLSEKYKNKKDSTELVGNYVDTWIKKQLMISKAITELSLDQQEIERKILDYRYSLIAYKYAEKYVDEQMDTLVTDEEIENYYNENRQNFQLKQNIIQGIFVKLPQNAPRLPRFEKMVRNKGDAEELRSYCYSFASDFFLEDTVWVNFNDIARNTPMINIPNKVQFLRNNSYYKTQDEAFLYYLRINKYKITDELSPLEFVKEQISKLILLKRRVEIAKELEQEIYESAKNTQQFEVYR